MKKMKQTHEKHLKLQISLGAIDLGAALTLPMTQTEVKEQLTERQNADEAKAITWLASKESDGSVAGKIYSSGN